MPDSVEYRAYTISADGHIQKRFDLTAPTSRPPGNRRRACLTATKLNYG